MEIWKSQRLSAIPWLVHGTATRDFGSTRYPNSGEADVTRDNRDRFVHELGLDPTRLVVSENVHGRTVVAASAKSPSVERMCDGLFTNERGLVLGVKTADCLPLFFVDPVVETVAIAHAGWKGVAAGIAMEAVRVLVEIGSRPSNLLIAIGPSIGFCHYAITEDRRMEMLGRTPSVSPEDFSNSRVDLRSIVTRQLVASGIRPENIDASAPCTACEPERFASYFLSHDFHQGMLSVIAHS